MTELSSGETAILSGSIAFAIGIWAGILLVPPEAVALPVSEGEYGNLQKVVFPIGRAHLLAQVTAIGAAVWFVFVREEPEEVDDDAE